MGSLECEPSKQFGLAIVTTELHPQTRGGIGVLYGNILRTYAREDSRILVLNASNQIFDQSMHADMYPNTMLVNVREVLERPSLLPPGTFSLTAEWHHLGYLALQALLVLRDEGFSWDVLEFQDFGGLAAPTLNARPLYPEQLSGVMNLRIHGPEGVLRRHSPRAPWPAHAVVMDLERQALRDADHLIIHGQGVLAELEAAFDLHDLSSKSIVQCPPVGQSNGVRPGVSRPPLKNRVVFGSKLDAIKSPDLFLRAVSILAAKRPDIDVVVMADQLAGADAATGSLIASLNDSEYLAWMPDLPQQMRRQMLAESCVVIAGSFEAFCLLAYETAMLGGRPVVSEANPAFGPLSPWVDGVNCWKFDGTSQGLARVLEMRVGEMLSDPLVWEHDEVPYWMGVETRHEPISVEVQGTVGLVVTNRDLERFAPDCLQSILDQDRRPDQVVLVDDGSRCADALADTRDQLLECGVAVELVRNSAATGLGAARNLGVSRLNTDYVVFLDIDDILDPRFLCRASRVLDSTPLADVVVPFVSCVSSFEDYLISRQDHVLPMLGATYFTRYQSNLLSTATCLLRRSSMPQSGFDESLPMYEDWDLWCHMAERGANFVVDPEIGLWYRQRADGMATEFRDSIVASYSLDRLRTNSLKRGAGRVPATALTDFLNPTPSEMTTSEVAELSRLSDVEREAAQIFNRKVVRFALAIGDRRHRKRNRDESRRASVFGTE